TGAKAMAVSTDEGDAYGVNAYGGSIVSGDIESITVTASDNAYGALAEPDSDINLVMSGDMSVSSIAAGEAIGIGAFQDSNVTVTGLSDLTVAANEGVAVGIEAYDISSSDVTMNGNINVAADGNAYGALAWDASQVYLTGAKAMTVSADAGEAYGLLAQYGSTVSADVESITATATGDAYGAYAYSESSIDVVMSGDITVTSTSVGEAVGIGALTSSDVTIRGLKDLTVAAKDGNATGIEARDNSRVYVAMTGDISVEAVSGDAYGATAQGDSYISLIGAKAMSVSADAGDAYGLYALNNSSRMRAEVESIEVTASGKAYGIVGVLGGEVEAILSGDVTVRSTTSGEAVGIGTDYDGGTVVEGLEDLFVSSVSGDVVGIGADNDGYTKVAMTGDITVESTVSGDATGIGADRGGDVIVTGLEDLFVNAKAGAAVGIAADNESNVNVQMDGTAFVETEAGPAYGIYADDESGVVLTGGDLDVTGTQKARGLYADGDSSIRMTNGDIAINETADSAYMEVNDGGAVFLSGVTANTNEGGIISEDRTLITTDSYGTVSADLGTVIGGNMIHTGIESGDLDITITGGSKIIGAASADISNSDARINITLNSLADTDTWEVTADSYTNGTLTNRGTVDYQKVESLLDYNNGTEPGDFKTVTVDNFVGNDESAPEEIRGILQMKADINGEENDLLIAEETAEGTNRIEIQNLTNSGIERSGTLVKVYEDETTLDLEIANPDGVDASGQYVVDAGAWNYVLTSGDFSDVTGTGTEWYLTRNSLTSTGQGIVSSIVHADTWYREVGTLLNRMGIYRDGQYYGGFWFEAAANKQETDGGFGSQYDQQFTNFTVGWDKMYAKENGDLFIGIMGGYGKADRDIGSIGTTDLESTHAALYGIYRTHDGFYATGLVKYNKYDNDMSLFGVDNFSRKLLAELGEERVKGNWDQNGYGASLQIGKRMDRENGWYLEPQAQLSWMRVNGESYRTNTGIQVDIDDADSFRGRLGLLVGRSMNLRDETKLDLFGSLSLVHEFEGETDITMSGGKWTSDLSGTWGLIGAGFNWNFQPGKYLHGGLSYATGDNRDEPWGVYLGLSVEIGGTRSSKEKVEEAVAETEAEAEAKAE
ncbi:MAG: autotransporter outer membrane beta-barrel domain-containing protein, partial [Synergistaceae bacterium]|nr:autotransporter outer membrane beta-barrel domain-containing protein [Synergistaceae bacterium]